MPLYILLYVDDMLLVSKSPNKLSELKDELIKAFDRKDLGNDKSILGMIILVG